MRIIPRTEPLYQIIYQILFIDPDALRIYPFRHCLTEVLRASKYSPLFRIIPWADSRSWSLARINTSKWVSTLTIINRERGVVANHIAILYLAKTQLAHKPLVTSSNLVAATKC